MSSRVHVAALLAFALSAPAAATGALDPPKWDVPERVVAEATGPDGAVVTYAASATTRGAEPRSLAISCSPASGSRFALGETTVTCRVTDDDDDYENERKSFTVLVRDTTAPVLSAPAPIQLTSAGGAPIPANDARIAAFLGGATASDAVSGSRPVANDAPASFPLGATAVTFTAVDAAGNRASVTVTVTVVAGPAPPAVDEQPPAPVSGARAATGSRRVVLTWATPADPDFDRVEIVRTVRGGASIVVYRGAGTRFTDTSVRNGVLYVYAIRSFDSTGNAGSGVMLSARPRASRLLSPLHGAALSAPPVLRWLRISGATYYNVQLWRNGRKILSRWPGKPSFALTTRWSYGGRQHVLSAGTYTWYVWPGFGRRSVARYGKLLGSRSFEILAR